jgi:hypothetical protein
LNQEYWIFIARIQTSLRMLVIGDSPGAAHRKPPVIQNDEGRICQSVTTPGGRERPAACELTPEGGMIAYGFVTKIARRWSATERRYCCWTAARGRYTYSRKCFGNKTTTSWRKLDDMETSLWLMWYFFAFPLVWLLPAQITQDRQPSVGIQSNKLWTGDNINGSHMLTTSRQDSSGDNRN